MLKLPEIEGNVVGRLYSDKLSSVRINGGDLET
jgi:hypothetical protein